MELGILISDVPRSWGAKKQFDSLLRQVEAAQRNGFTYITIGQHFLYGDLTFIDRSGRRLFEVSGATMDCRAITRNPDTVRQPGTFWRADLYREIGGIDETLHLVMDLDFFLRAGALCRFHHLGRGLSMYRYYGENKSVSLARNQVREIVAVYRKNGVALTPHLARILLSKYARTFGTIRRLEDLLRGRREIPR